jgi:hypothetical protein
VETEVPFTNPVGGHQVVFYGDLEEQLVDLAERIGFGIRAKPDR